MKRVRLGTTNYNDVPDHEPSSDGSGSDFSPPIEESARRDDRWTVRRASLSRALILDAQREFEKRLGRQVSENEARNLLGNLADYLWMLIDWQVNPPPEPPVKVSAKRGRRPKNPT